jgi:hypothetical protein
LKLVRNADDINNNTRKAAFREDSDDNFLFCPRAVDVHREDLRHFQSHWSKGEPVIVSNVLECSSGLSWEPLVMWRAFRQITNSKHDVFLDVKAVNCLDWCEVCLISHSLAWRDPCWNSCLLSLSWNLFLIYVTDVLKIWVRPNLTLQNLHIRCEIYLTYKHNFGLYLIRCGTLIKQFFYWNDSAWNWQLENDLTVVICYCTVEFHICFLNLHLHLFEIERSFSTFNIVG